MILKMSMVLRKLHTEINTKTTKEKECSPMDIQKTSFGVAGNFCNHTEKMGRDNYI